MAQPSKVKARIKRTRLMRDSTNIGDIPRRTKLVAAYMNGSYANDRAARAKFGRRNVHTISTGGRCRARFYDVENGDYVPDSPDLIANLRADQKDNYKSYIYCSLSNVTAVKDALRYHKLLKWQGNRFWIAWYRTPPNKEIPNSALLCQYLSPVNGAPGHYDESTLAFYCPGIDSEHGARAIITRLRKRIKR